MKDKFPFCKYCNEPIEKHHHAHHQKTCYLNPDNLKKICEYLSRGILTPKLLNRKNFYDWAKQNKILTSITITSRLGVESWNIALYQLLVYGYLSSFISFEYVEVILLILTDGSMWMDDSYDIYKELTKLEIDMNGISEILCENYYTLLTAILDRTVRDLSYNHGEVDENNEVVDMQITKIDNCIINPVSFLASFAPELLHYHVEQNNLSDDAHLLYQTIFHQYNSD